MRKVALLLAVLLASCAGIQDLARSAVKTPKLTFRSASVQAFDLEGATVAFTWDLENPNAFGVDLARVGWTVDVEGTRIAAWFLEEAINLAGERTSITDASPSATSRRPGGEIDRRQRTQLAQ